MLLVRQRQRADKLPHVVLLLERAEQLVVGWGERSKLHGRKVRALRRRAQDGGGARNGYARRHAQPRYGPPGTPQPHRGIGALGSTVAPGCEFTTARREPHSR